MFVVNVTAIATLAFLAFVTWLGLRYAARARFLEAELRSTEEDLDDPDPYRSARIPRAEQYEGEADTHRENAKKYFATDPSRSRRERIAALVYQRAAELLRTGSNVVEVERWITINIEKKSVNDLDMKRAVVDEKLADSYHEQAADLRVQAARSAVKCSLVSELYTRGAKRALEAESRIRAGDDPEDVENWLRDTEIE